MIPLTGLLHSASQLLAQSQASALLATLAMMLLGIEASRVVGAARRRRRRIAP